MERTAEVNGARPGTAAEGGVAELVLLHSPLVGAGFWQPVAQKLEGRGVRCRLPTAAEHAREPVAWRDWPRAAGAELDVAAGAVVVGHSAAGFLLPSLARLLDASGLVFVDALIPPDAGVVAPADREFLEFVGRLPTDGGRLPPWSRWWGAGAIERLIGNADAYTRFEAELPRLAASWFDDRIDVPPWRHLPAGYLQTSERFAPTADDARQRQWPVRALSGTHLHPLTHAGDTANALLQLVASLAPHV